MAERISWSSFPELRDFDHFSKGESPGTPGEINITLATDPRITSWKSIKFSNVRTGRTLHESELRNGNHGPVSIRIIASDYSTHRFTINKAKIFGIHTEMYDIFELSQKDGINISLTWLTDGPDNVWQAIGHFFSEVANAVVAAVVTVVRAIVTVVEAIFGFLLNAIVWIGGLILAIPVIGRFIEWLINIIGWLISTIINIVLDFVFFLGLFLGISPPEKLLRIVIIVQQDEFGVPVATLAQVQSQLDSMIELFKVRANIKVIPFKPFQFTTPFTSSGALSAEDFTVFENRPSLPQTLDVNTNALAFRDDLLSVGSSFELKINNLFWGNTRRIIGHGAPIYVFAVRSFIGSGTVVGSSEGPFSNYVTVNFKTSRVGAMAHECGHACNLWVHVLTPSTNLMQPGPSALPLTLEDGQVALLRASSHCTFV